MLHSTVDWAHESRSEEAAVIDVADRKAVWTAGAGVAVVALTAAVISFSHVRQLAIEAGESELASWLLPISIDGAIAAAVAVILADSRAGRRPAVLTWMLLALGLAGSLAANIASAEPTMVARAVAAWPPVALALGIEVLAGLARRRDRMPGPARAEAPCQAASRERPEAVDQRDVVVRRHVSGGTGPAPAASANGTAGPGMGAPGSPPAGGGRNGSGSTVPAGRPPALEPRQPIDDAEAVAVIQQLDAAAPDGRVSRLEIQKRLHCGGSRAARLAELARSR